MPYEAEKFGVDVYNNLDEAMEGVDVVNILRIQLERQKAGLFPSQREYTNLFGITSERLKRLNENYTIMHPGPMNRGVEITNDVADGPSSVILKQVTNGQAVRMAVLYLISGAADQGEKVE
jgi:aspartate carbamoyltransferase catalytic subunit